MNKENYTIPNITSLRFILALLVVIFHISEFSKNRRFPFFNDLPIFNKGTESVWVFFSLSGFLIIKQLYNEKRQTNSISFKTFYLKRVLRIFPLYYLVLTIGFLYYRLVLPYLGYDVENNYPLFTGLLLSISFFPNIFSSYGPGGILEILWSIGIEEQFYLFIAPLIAILPSKKIISFLSIFTVLYFSIYYTPFIPFFKEYHMYFFYFSFGGICSILLDNYSSFKIILHKLRNLIGVIAILYFTTNIFRDYLNEIPYHIFSVILFGITISVLSLKPIKILQNKPMVYLGKISYGIYMFHAIVLQFVGLLYMKGISKLNLNDTLDIILINILVIAITIGVSHLSFKYYEGYFLTLKRKITTKK